MINPKIATYFKENKLPSPCLVVDMAQVAAQYQAITRAISYGTCHYAVKANPAPQIIKYLINHGASFDAASINEIRLCLDLGAKPENILFGNTIKKEEDIAESYQRGVRSFTFDSTIELDKLARSAPGSKLFCRLNVGERGATWPLSKKFGCTEENALKLMVEVKKKGLVPYALSFHVGSQQTHPESYAEAIAITARVSEKLKKKGIIIEAIDVGGGFPAHYRNPVPPISTYGNIIKTSLEQYFGTDHPKVIYEPGRFIVAEAGVIRAEVVLISYNKETGRKRWVYLDIGKFTGFVETEAIEYQIMTENDNDGSGSGRVILAGPTCDSVDIIYEKAEYRLSNSLGIGDKLYFLTTGAYTTTYSAIAFNGFPPLTAFYID